MLSMRELSLSMPGPLLSLSMLLLATYGSVQLMFALRGRTLHRWFGGLTIFWLRPGLAWAGLWADLGPTPGRPWADSGQALGRLWPDFGPTLG